jgi:hypothetical protein
MSEICFLLTEAHKQERGMFGILGQVFIHETEKTNGPPDDKKAGTADFYYCNNEQFQIINRAVARAKKLTEQKATKARKR